MKIPLRKETSMTAKQYNELYKEKRSEHDEQVEVVKYCDAKGILMFAIPNGTNKSLTAQRMFKAEGLKSGVPDLMIPIANKYYHGLFIEMKRRAKRLKNGKKSISHTKVSPEQEQWLNNLSERGYCAIVCYGADDAIEMIEDYLERV